MIKSSTVFFLVFSSLFAVTHLFAIAASLYWYLWWFDIVMHAWGGFLLVFGVHVFSTFSWSPIQPTWLTVLGVLLIAIVSWEVFEWFAGLYDPHTYVFDTTKDVVVGLSAGILTQLFLQTYRIK